MRIAVISDIHGNPWALEAVLEDIGARSVDRIVNLGDHFYGPIAPAETWLILRGLDCLSLCGNQDRMLFAPQPDEAARAANPTLRFVMESLGDDALAWLAGLPTSMALAEGPYLCHGAVGRDDLYFLEDINSGHPVVATDVTIAELLGNVRAELILCGHTHIPRTVQLLSGQLLVNPGSVGLPAYADDLPLPHTMENCSPHARYALVEKVGLHWQILQLCVPYDWDAAARAASAQGRDDWAYCLRTGRVRSGV